MIQLRIVRPDGLTECVTCSVEAETQDWKASGRYSDAEIGKMATARAAEASRESERTGELVLCEQHERTLRQAQARRERRAT